MKNHKANIKISCKIVILTLILLTNIKCLGKPRVQENDNQITNENITKFQKQKIKIIKQEIEKLETKIGYEKNILKFKKIETNKIKDFNKLKKKYKKLKKLKKNLEFINKRKKYKQELIKNNSGKIELNNNNKYTKLDYQLLITKNNQRINLEQKAQQAILAQNKNKENLKNLSNNELNKIINDNSYDIKQNRKNNNKTTTLKEKYNSLQNLTNPFGEGTNNFDDRSINALGNEIKILNITEQKEIIDTIKEINTLSSKIQNKTILPLIPNFDQKGYIVFNEEGKLKQIKTKDELFEELKIKKPTNAQDYLLNLQNIKRDIKLINQTNEQINEIFKSGNLKIGDNAFNETDQKYILYDKNLPNIEKHLKELEIGQTSGDRYVNSINPYNKLNLTYNRDKLINKLTTNDMKIPFFNKGTKVELKIVKTANSRDVNKKTEYNIFDAIAPSNNSNDLMHDNNNLEILAYVNQKKLLNLYYLIKNALINNSNENLNFDYFYKDIKNNKLNVVEIREKLINNYNQYQVGNILKPNNGDLTESIFNNDKIITIVKDILKDKNEKNDNLLVNIFNAIISIIKDMYKKPIKKHFKKFYTEWEEETTEKEIISKLLNIKKDSKDNIAHKLADLLNLYKNDENKIKRIEKLILFLQKEGLNLEIPSRSVNRPNNKRLFEEIIEENFNVKYDNNKQLISITKKIQNN